MHVLEKHDEYTILSYCNSLDIRCLKLRLASESSWPDRTLLYKGRMMFLEFKRKGEKPTPLQQYTLDRLTDNGFKALWVDDVQIAKVIIYEWKLHADYSKPFMA